MRAKTKFLKMFNKLPSKARQELVYDFTGALFSLNVCAMEVKNNTKHGAEILKVLGYTDD